MRYFLLIISLFLASIAVSQSYYPLNPANRWYYDSSSTGNNVRVLSDSLFPNGKHYSVLSREDFVFGRYVRVDSHYVYYYEPSELKDVPFFKLDGKKGDTTFISFGHVVITAIDSGTVFNERTRIIRYQLVSLQLREITLSEKFGLVNASLYADPPPPWPDIVYNLVGCIIDGKSYGYTTSRRESEISTREFSLNQNYPNPFNPTTTIQFSITSDNFVQLSLFDNLGRELAPLVSTALSAGKHQVHLNGGKLASGTYYYRLKVGNMIQTRKLVLLR